AERLSYLASGKRTFAETAVLNIVADLSFILPPQGVDDVSEKGTGRFVLDAGGREPVSGNLETAGQNVRAHQLKVSTQFYGATDLGSIPLIIDEGHEVISESSAELNALLASVRLQRSAALVVSATLTQEFVTYMAGKVVYVGDQSRCVRCPDLTPKHPAPAQNEWRTQMAKYHQDKVRMAGNFAEAVRHWREDANFALIQWEEVLANQQFFGWNRCMQEEDEWLAEYASAELQVAWNDLAPGNLEMIMYLEVHG
ncbi:unnamed protein product, partial [Symbiodinium sp. KB8]